MLGLKSATRVKMRRLFEGGPTSFPGLQCEDEGRDEEGLIKPNGIKVSPKIIFLPVNFGLSYLHYVVEVAG